MGIKVGVIAAHPDDEILGCGATMAKHVAQGDEVHVLILAEGLTSRTDQRDVEAFTDELSDLAKAAEKASRVIGVKSLQLEQFPDNRMDSIDRLDLIKVVEAFIQDNAFHTVYTHHSGDLNIDHCCVHEAVITACRPLPGASVKELLFFEVASSTEWQPPKSGVSFAPNHFVDVGKFLDKKLKALEAYRMEMREWPHPRSLKAVEHLAHWRGATIGVDAAEAFVVGRQIK